jgi:mono/diheme cytochrome c family protein
MTTRSTTKPNRRLPHRASATANRSPLVFRNQILVLRRQPQDRHPSRRENLSVRAGLIAAACALALAAGARTARADGHGIFISNCAVCHQPDGKGAPSVYPPLADSVGRYVALKDGRAYVIDVVSFGMGGKIQSQGDTFEGDMPPWPQLSNEDVARVLTYVMTGLNPKLVPANFKPISADEVKAERARQLDAAAVHAERESLMKELESKAAK